MVNRCVCTPTTLDDQFAAIIASVLNNHQAILEVIINRIRAGRELSATQMSTMLETIGVSSYEHGFTYNKNSWCDGRGKQRLEDVKAQINSSAFDCFVVLDIERTRKGKANYGL